MSHRHPEPDVVLAWFIAPGDILAGGIQVISVDREVQAGTVRISTTLPETVLLDHDHPVRVLRQVS